MTGLTKEGTLGLLSIAASTRLMQQVVELLCSFLTCLNVSSVRGSLVVRLSVYYYHCL